MPSIKIELEKSDSSTAGFISWHRLTKHLKNSGELKPNERVVRIEADSDGLKYYVESD